MSEWVKVPLADLCERITSGGTPKRSRTDYYAAPGAGHPWIKSSELRDGYVRMTEEEISDLGLKESAAKLIPPDSVLVAMYGATAGKVGLLKLEAAVNQAISAVIPDPEFADPVFIYHSLRSRYDELAGKSAGAAQQNLNGQIIKSFEIDAPGLRTQQRIAAVLSAFDELIEVNERRIELLEDLARSLYREWFVHFRFPGHENVRMVDSDLGPIPEGWEVRKLGELAEVNPLRVKKSELPDPVAYLDIKSIGIGCVEEPPLVDAENAPGRARRRASDGDTVWSTVRPNRRSHGLLHNPPPNLVISTGLAVLSPRKVGSAYLYLYTDDPAFTDYLVSRTSGAAYPAVRPPDFAKAPILKPTPGTLEAFVNLTEPLLREVSGLRSESDALSRTRDLLLPRLVTGKLDISDLELGVLEPAEAA